MTLWIIPMNDDRYLTAKEVIDHFGAKQICEAVDVGRTRVANAKSDGVFPATWMMGIKQLCALHRVPFNEGWFSFKSPKTTSPSTEIAQLGLEG
ncbi:MAG: hypothetical protein ABJL99_09830 [Aliishimia sp.]